MQNALLNVVTCISNPIRWKSRITLYNQFEEEMLDSGVKLTTVECAFGERPYELSNPHVNHVKVRANAGALVWNKENLLNIGINRLHADAKYIATIDADVSFRQSGWAAETVHALQHYAVVQPWSECYDLGPNDEHLETHTAFTKLVFQKKPIVQGPNAMSVYKFGHPGYAWAYTRQALEWVGGLIESAGLGAADHHQAMALIGRVDESIPENISEAYKAPLRLWQSRAMANIHKNISFVPGTIEHRWHGQKALRAYVDRWQILINNKFDPSTDLKKNTYGVVELASNKPELRLDIDRYFRSRNEDANTVD